jgi:hypothetical protein
MYGRVVRFTDVSAERISEIVGEVESSDPPEGVDASGFELFFDEGQGTAVFVAYFDSEEKMRAADAAFDAMDASETPGTRASVDRAEIKVQRSLS